MRRPRAMIGALAVVAALGVAAGCGSDDDDSADSTTEAAPATEPAPTTEAEPATEAEPTTEAAPGGDVQAGLVVFQQTCTGCHLDDGTSSGGIGPQLSGQGLTADDVRNQVINGGGTMPAGLATGQDLDDVVAYVESLQ